MLTPKIMVDCVLMLLGKPDLFFVWCFDFSYKAQGCVSL
jgi:hypothetical protein